MRAIKVDRFTLSDVSIATILQLLAFILFGRLIPDDSVSGSNTMASSNYIKNVAIVGVSPARDPETVKTCTHQ